MKLLLRIRYDGRAYCGFQAQPNGTAIQTVLTEAASTLLGFPCNITGCSRTDSGVHALGFCATLEPKEENRRTPDWCRIPAGKFHRAINVHLPSDIAVRAAAFVPEDFHARYNVIEKTYEYHILRTPARDPFLDGRAFHVPRPISEEGIGRMRRTAAVFIGRHDFTGYMATGSKITDANRTVTSAEIVEAGDEVIFRVSADGFLYNMVRIMAGTLLDCAYGRLRLEDAERALQEGDRSLAGFTAPACGLYLCQVQYDRPIDWRCE